LEDANYFNCRLHWLTGELRSQGDGRFTARTEVVHDFKRKSDPMNTWTDEELKAHLDEWDTIYRTGGRLDIGLNQYPVMFDGDGTQTQTILRCGSEQIALAATQLYEVDTWFRHHPMKTS